MNHLTNLSSFFLNLLEAEQDGEEQSTGANVEEKKQKMGEVCEAILSVSVCGSVCLCVCLPVGVLVCGSDCLSVGLWLCGLSVC